MKAVAVAILNYNGSAWLKKFLPTVIAHSPYARVVVIDNHSTDDSCAFVRNTPGAELMETGGNLGYSGGYNYALARISEPLVVLLNSDVEVTAGWLEGPVALMQSNTNIAALQPKILSWHRRNEFEYAGAAGGMIDYLGYPFCRGRIFETLETDHGQYNDRLPVAWATGACMFVRRDHYLDCGGLDEYFFAHMEEIDLCWRFSRAGYAVWYDGTSTVYHVGGGTLDALNPRKTFLNFRNALILLIKNLPMAKLVWTLPLRMMLDWLASARFLASGKPAHSWAILSAHGQLLWHLGVHFGKRKAISTHAASMTPTYPRSIISEYFLRKRRTYSELPQ